jgi:spermidine/putrescine transport system permease protein
MVFMPAVSTFVISGLLGGDKTPLIGDLIEQQFMTNRNWHFGSSLSIILMVMILISMAIMSRIERNNDRRRGVHHEKNGCQDLYGSYIYIFLYAPIILLIVFSFNKSKSRDSGADSPLIGILRSSRTADQGSPFLHHPRGCAGNSNLNHCGTIAAIGIHNFKRFPKAFSLNVNNLPVLNPDIVTGVSLMTLFISTSIPLGFGTMLIAHIVFCIPYVILAVLPKLKQLNRHLAEAAMDLGATPWVALRKVILPEITPGIISGALLAFTLSIDDFVISFFTAGTEATNLSILIYSMAKRGVKPSINALSTMLFIVVVTLLLIVNKKSEKGEELYL